MIKFFVMMQTLTHMRLMVNILTGLMLGSLWLQAGDKGDRVLDNYNLLFSILIHHVMSTMMLAILTCESSVRTTGCIFTICQVFLEDITFKCHQQTAPSSILMVALNSLSNDPLAVILA